MRNFKPKHNYVLIKLEKKDDGPKRTKSGIYLPNDKEEKSSVASPSSHNFIVEAVGPDVKTVKVGEYVIFNEYDLKGIKDDDDNHYGICKEESIFATYEN